MERFLDEVDQIFQINHRFNNASFTVIAKRRAKNESYRVLTASN